MNPNPYQPPGQQGGPGMGYTPPPAQNSGIFMLAGIGAGLASAYWAALTLLIGVGVASGSVSGAQIILPCVLIVLYAVRAVQIFRGEAAAARRVLWLHGIGGVMALLQVFSGGAMMIVLQGIKVLIHVFGAITAYLALRSVTQAAAAPPTYPMSR